SARSDRDTSGKVRSARWRDSRADSHASRRAVVIVDVAPGTAFPAALPFVFAPPPEGDIGGEDRDNHGDDEERRVHGRRVVYRQRRSYKLCGHDTPSGPLLYVSRRLDRHG